MTKSQSRELWFDSVDGLRLHAWDWGNEDADKTLVIVHGYGEHAGRYVDRAKTFTKAGYRVLAIDVRGHGLSEGVRGHTMSFANYFSDLERLARHIQTPKERTVILGHSHGGLIVVRRTLQDPTFFTASVVTSPMLGLGMEAPAWKVTAGRLLSKFLPKFSLPTEINPKELSHDPQVAEDYAKDPLTHKVVNTRWFTEAMDAIEVAFRDASKVAVPMLVIQSGGDLIVSPEATRRWAASAPSNLVTFEEVPLAYHELLFELDGETHNQRILAFFESQLA